MKKQISMKLKAFKYVLIPIALILLYNVYLIYTDASLYKDLMLKIIFPLGSLLLLLVLYKIFMYYEKNTTQITFDKVYVYVENKESSYHIPLQNITELKMISSYFGNHYKIQLTHIGANGIKETLEFFPRFMYLFIPELGNLILSKNKEAKISRLFYKGFLIEKTKN